MPDGDLKTSCGDWGDEEAAASGQGCADFQVLGKGLRRQLLPLLFPRLQMGP